jgi:transposase
MMLVDDAITKPVHRLEVFTGAGRRRTWSDEDKARIVDEIVASGESLSAVARRHGLSPQQLFGWRRQLQASSSDLLDAEEPSFVPAVLDVAPSASIRSRRKMPRREVESNAGMIDVALDGITVRIGPEAPAATIAAVLRALRVGT